MILPLLVLAACGTPQERCIARNTRDLTQVNRFIAEAQGNLARGYAYEDVTDTRMEWVPCYAPPATPGDKPKPHLCWEERTYTERRAKAIDLGAEQSKLEGLLRKRDELLAAAQPVIAQCKAEYPK